MKISREQIKRKATNLVYHAVKRGELPKLDGTIQCVDCGMAANQYDHRDYRKPLEVDPVCGKCNVKRGLGEPILKNSGKRPKKYKMNYSHMDEFSRNIILRIGGATAVSRLLGLARQTVHAWKKIPKNHVEKIRKIRPDIFK